MAVIKHKYIFKLGITSIIIRPVSTLGHLQGMAEIAKILTTTRLISARKFLISNKRNLFIIFIYILLY